jgi:RNA ligase
MKLNEYINKDQLREYINNGLVTCQRHNEFPLVQFTYSRKCVLDDIWDDITIKCRGLIVNSETDEIVARPFEKFFNINTLSRPETMLENLPKTTRYTTEKLDGSLGILYEYNDKWYCATKGSFHSEQAEWANKWLEGRKLTFPKDFTPLVEIICQDVQHHVVHYDEDRLVLIGLISNNSGEEKRAWYLEDYCHFCGIDIETVPYNCYFNGGGRYLEPEELLKLDRDNKEGYVVSWPLVGKPPLKVKIKHPTFLKNQKFLHNMTAKKILAALSTSSIPTDIANYPQHIQNYVKEWVDYYSGLYEEIFKTSSEIVKESITKCTTRKETAEFFLQNGYSFYAPVCFSMIDATLDKPSYYKKIIWKLVDKLSKERDNKKEEIWVDEYRD